MATLAGSLPLMGAASTPPDGVATRGLGRGGQDLEAARLQTVFVPVLELLLATQSNLAVHGAPNLRIAWQAARTAGLELQRGQRDADRPEIAEVLRQDMADIRSLNVRQTPTFFVNGKPLQSFGQRQLVDLVRSEVEAASRK